jgi:hypothetical protein
MAAGSGARERLLVNFFYAHPVGHAIEALHYANGYHAADPELEIAVALNAATAVELASFCTFVSAAYAIEQPLLEPNPPSLAGLPREWTWVVDDGRRHQDIQLELFPGLRDYYAAGDRHLIAVRGRGIAGGSPPAYVPHHPLRLELPETARAAADELAGLLAHRSRPVDCFDVALPEQLAMVEACDVFLSPHTGFGLAALAVGTPWLALSGGRWFEYFFNHVPFRSVIPDTGREQRELTEEPDGERDGPDAVDVLVPRVHRGIMP